jgi:predicted SAM-dependent methyltransferase
MRKIVLAFLSFMPKSLRSHIIFEMQSSIGRMITGRLSLDTSKKNYINLGCGDSYIPSQINIDFFFPKFKIDYGSDLRYPLKIDNNSIDGIFTEHTLEHLTYDQNDRLMAECFRIMKPGAVFRILVPDVSLFANNYAANNKAWFDEWERLMFINSESKERAARKLSTPMEAISFVTQEYYHMACWDFQTMKYYLEKNGFKNVTNPTWRQGKDPELLRDLDSADRKYVTLYVEAER